MNLTNQNMTGIPPYISASSTTSKTITSQLSQAINATVVVNVIECPSSATMNGAGVSYDSCDGDQAIYSLTVNSASNSLLLSYSSNSIYDCNGNTTTLQSSIYLLVPMAVVFLVLMFLVSLGIFTGFFGNVKVDGLLLITIASVFVVLLVILAVGVYIVSTLPC